MLKHLLKTCAAVLAIAALSTGPARGQTEQTDFVASTDGNTYTINTKAGWDTLCARVLRANTFMGKTILLNCDLTGTNQVEDMCGRSFQADGHATQDRHFQGAFDGQGHTIEVNYYTANPDLRFALFPKVDEHASIRNLHVTGFIYNGAGRANGLVATCAAGTIIDNCWVSVEIHGGIHSSGISMTGGTVTNTIFDGILNVNGSTSGGFFGYPENGSSITNCIFKPISVTSNETLDWGTFFPPHLPAGFTNITVKNSYYFTKFGTLQGKAARTVLGELGVTVFNAGTPDTHNVSNIISYGTGTTADTLGLTYNDTLYGGIDDILFLTLDGAPTSSIANGYRGGYAASAGTLAGTTNPYSLTMADTNTYITMNLFPAYTLRQIRTGWTAKKGVAHNVPVMITEGTTEPVTVDTLVRLIASAADGYKVKELHLDPIKVDVSLFDELNQTILVCGNGDTLTGNAMADILIVVPDGDTIVLNEFNVTNTSAEHPAILLQGSATLKCMGSNNSVSSSGQAAISVGTKDIDGAGKVVAIQGDLNYCNTCLDLNSASTPSLP